MDLIDWPNGNFSLICKYFSRLCFIYNHSASQRQISRYRVSIYGIKKSTPILEDQLVPLFILIQYLPAIIGMTHMN